MKDKEKAFIDPSSCMYYSSYYIQGLYDMYGKRNIYFNRKYFNDLKRREESHSFDHYMAYVIREGHTLNIYYRSYASPKKRNSTDQ